MLAVEATDRLVVVRQGQSTPCACVAFLLLARDAVVAGVVVVVSGVCALRCALVRLVCPLLCAVSAAAGKKSDSLTGSTIFGFGGSDLFKQGVVGVVL